ncbi:MAG: 2-oxo acid dehydrogenase subunit E2, partial [Chloroflexi bacterium]
VTTVMEADMSRVVAYRRRWQAEFRRREGLRLTFTPFFVRAVVEGLKAVPQVNSSFTDDGILLHRQIHIGIAVALEDGLIVPVIRDADRLSLSGLQRAVTDLAERARSRRLRPDEVQGATFTITNHGVSGSLFATPIINQPNAGILGIGAIQKRPVVVTVEGVDSIAIKPMCYLSFTFDHRVLDGAVADRFLAKVVEVLEHWS